MSAAELTALEAQYAFDRRHIGPSEAEITEMLIFPLCRPQ
jgi:hypothetical protein